METRTSNGRGFETSWLVRYRFDDANQLRRHLHLAGPGPGFLFLRDRSLPFASGSRVMLEICLSQSEQRALLVGFVHLRAREGLWLELPGASATAAWLSERNGARRMSRRLAADIYAEVRRGREEPCFCRVADLSLAGVRLASTLPGGVSVGEDLAVRVIPSEPGFRNADLRAKVVWTRDGQMGLHVARANETHGELIHALESRWDHADMVRHPASCHCEGGGTVDEPPPHWRSR